MEDRLSQINTLQQLVHVASHGFLREFLEQGDVHLHAMWFDIYTGEMYLFSRERQRFVVVNEQTSNELTAEIHRRMDDAAKPKPVQAANGAS